MISDAPPSSSGHSSLSAPSFTQSRTRKRVPSLHAVESSQVVHAGHVPSVQDSTRSLSQSAPAHVGQVRVKVLVNSPVVTSHLHAPPTNSGTTHTVVSSGVVGAIVDNVVDSVVETVDAVVDSVVETVDTVVEAVDTVVEAVDAVVDSVVETLDAVVDSVVETVDAVVEAVDTVVEAVDAVVDSVVDSVVTVVDFVVTTVDAVDAVVVTVEVVTATV